MEEDKNNTSQQDVERISLLEEYDILNWSEKFKVTPEQLKRAIIDVGTKVKLVEKYIRSR